MSQVYPILKVNFSQFLQLGGGVEIQKSKIFHNRKSMYSEIQVALKFGEDWMNITLILFVHVIFSSKWSLKHQFLTKKGVKNQNFKKSKKVPLDNLEIHVVSKFGPIQMKIAACRCCYIRTTNNNERQTSHTPYRELNLQNSIRPSTTLNDSP